MSHLVWSNRALDDLDSIAAYIARDSKRGAARVVSYIENSAQILETFPRLGRQIEDDTARELILTRYPYVLVYEIERDEVRVVAIFHQSQQRR